MPLILPSNSISAVGYEVDNSLRFDDGFSDRLIKTFSTSGNQRTVTFSTWFKISALGTIRHLFSNSGADSINLASNDTLEIQLGGSAEGYLYLNRVFRDPSAWYHIVFNMDTTQSTASNRLKVYINGIQETSFSSTSYPTQNLQTGFSENVQHSIGSRSANNDRFFDGYMTETVFIDGQQLDPTSFGEFDEATGIWKPIDVSELTFGTNGFYLDFENSGSLGADVSGNGNNWTVNNLTSIDQTTDTPTNNYSTLNPLDNYYAQATFSNGNLTMVTPVTEYAYVRSTMGVSSGKWYAECKITTASATDHSNGVAYAPATSITHSVGVNDQSYGYKGSGQVAKNNSNIGGTYASLSAGDIIGIYLDLDNNKLYFAKNGTIQNSGTGISIVDPASTTDGVYYFASSDNANLAGGTYQFDWNFGNTPFTISSGNTDPNGYGNFEYDPSAGTFDGSSKSFYALNTKNLAEYG